MVISICLYSLCKSDRYGVAKGLLPFVALAGYTYLISLENGLESWSFNGFIYPPLLRGLSGLALGVFLNGIQKEYNLLISKKISALCNILSLVLVVCLLAGIENYGMAILGFCGIILNSFYPQSNANRKTNKFVLNIGKWCYGAYLFHIEAIRIATVILRMTIKCESNCIGRILTNY